MPYSASAPGVLGLPAVAAGASGDVVLDAAAGFVVDPGVSHRLARGGEGVVNALGSAFSSAFGFAFDFAFDSALILDFVVGSRH